MIKWKGYGRNQSRPTERWYQSIWLEGLSKITDKELSSGLPNTTEQKMPQKKTCHVLDGMTCHATPSSGPQRTILISGFVA
jgi:hypothetical protein